jgi:MFS family permease
MSETGRRTLPWDLGRGVAAGAWGTVQATFALFVAIEYFEASTVQKALIAGAYSIGLLLSLPYAAWSPVLGKKTLRAGMPTLVGGASFVCAAMATSALGYTIAISIAGLSAAMSTPIMTAIYRDNYKGSVRGQIVGLAVVVSGSVSLLTQFLGGVLLERDLEWFRGLYFGMAALALFAGYAVVRMPTVAERDPMQPNPFSSFGAVRENPRFGYVLVAWFLFGFANLALMPQRIEYLTQARYGIELSAFSVVLIVGVTTEAARLCSVPLWARLFDRYNFIWLRMIISVFMFLHVVLYYLTSYVAMLVLASACLGLAFGGGAIAWQLWVTKFAPPEDTARYMAVHTFLTGTRGAIGPFVGYFCAEHLSLQATSWIAAALIFLSIAMLFRIRNQAMRM